MIGNNNNLKQLGQNIRKWRELKDIKQQELAAKLNRDKSWVSHVENGKIDISYNQIVEIANFFEIQPTLLLEDFAKVIQITQGNNSNAFGNYHNHLSVEALAILFKEVMQSIKEK